MPVGKLILNDAWVEVDGNDVSQYFSAIAIEKSKEKRDVTGFGAANRESKPGLGDANITGTFFQAVGAGEIDSIFWPLSDETVPFTVKVRASSDAIGTDNPEYRLDEALMYGYNPIDGTVGEESTSEVEFSNAGQGGLTRHTS